MRHRELHHRSGFLVVAAGLVLAAAPSMAAERGIATSPTSRPASAPAEQVVPAERIDTLLVVNGWIADSGPLRFIVDTGAGFVVLHAPAAERLNLPPVSGAAISLLSAGGEALPGGRPVTVPQLRLGPFVATNVIATTMDLTSVAEAVGEAVDGVLGMNALADGLVTLDYDTPALRFEPGSLPEPDNRDILPMKVFARVPVAVVRISKADVEVIVDSGANRGLSLPLKLRDRLPLAAPPVPAQAATTAGGPQETLAGRLAISIGIGRHVLERPLVELREGPPLLGGEALKHFRVTLDVHGGRIRFARKGNAPIPSEPFRTTGLSMAKKPRGWTVNGVVPNTPAAAAAIAPGDLLMSYDGKPADSLTMAIWVRLFDRTDALPCRFQRDDKTYDVLLRQAILVP